MSASVASLRQTPAQIAQQHAAGVVQRSDAQDDAQLRPVIADHLQVGEAREPDRSVAYFDLDFVAPHQVDGLGFRHFRSFDCLPVRHDLSPIPQDAEDRVCLAAPELPSPHSRQESSGAVSPFEEAAE
jgi:hypothetical protein